MLAATPEVVQSLHGLCDLTYKERHLLQSDAAPAVVARIVRRLQWHVGWALLRAALDVLIAVIMARGTWAGWGEWYPWVPACLFLTDLWHLREARARLAAVRRLTAPLVPRVGRP